MSGFIERLDELAGTGGRSTLVRWLERVAFAFLVLMVLSAPHSIAATQTAWLTGMFLWLVSVIVKKAAGRGNIPAGRTTPAPGHPSFVRRRALTVALWGFFLWSVVTSLTSYAPDISVDKLRGVSVFLIFFFVINNMRNLRSIYFVSFALILSCMVNVVWVPVERLIGRGVEIHGVASTSPLAKAALRDGDTLLEANGVKLTTPEQLADAMERSEVVMLRYYRPDFELVADVHRAELLPGSSAKERLGFASWKKSRNWRSRGFYGHYTTYAEVLQLIAALVLGLLVSFLAAKRFELQSRRDAEKGEKRRQGESEIGRETPFKEALSSPRLPFSASPFLVFSLLVFCLAAMSTALLLTVTRASQLAFLVSAVLIVLFGLGRKWLFATAAIGLPLALIGLFFLQQSRQVGFFDVKDDSIRWRQTVWREGFDLWTENPRHFFLGVGMDSIKRFAPEWGLFDRGRLPMGHFHSTPLNLAVERGLPALILWLIVLGIYTRTLWRGLTLAGAIPNPVIRIPHSKNPPAYAGGSDRALLPFGWIRKGILLGCLGGIVGFFTSGLVHYNLGDQEVAMIFFLLMGLSVRTVELSTQPPGTEPSAASAIEYRMAA